MKPHPQSRVSRRRPRHALPARHQGDAEGDADGRRPAGDPACRRRGARGRHRALHLRHRPQQGGHRGLFRHQPSSSRRRCASAARPRRSRSCARPAGAPAQTSFTRQQAPLGLGHAVWCARDIVGDEPFAVLLPDMLHQAGEPGVPRRRWSRPTTRSAATSSPSSEAPEDQTHQYGIVGRRRGRSATMPSSITGMVEKPKPGTAPSNLFISGRYILQPEIFELLEKQERGAGGEIQLTDAMIDAGHASSPSTAAIFNGAHLRLRHRRSASSPPTSPLRWPGRVSATSFAPS